MVFQKTKVCSLSNPILIIFIVLKLTTGKLFYNKQSSKEIL